MKIEEKVKEEKLEDYSEVKTPPPSRVRRSTPRQEQLEKEIVQISTEIDAIKVFINGPNPRLEDRKALNMKLQQQKKCVAALKRCKALQRASRKHRKKIASIMKLANKAFRPFPGRPALEEYEEFKELPTLILREAQQYAAADPKRRAEILTIPNTLNELQLALSKKGLEVNRATLYTRLLPRRKNCAHGRRHINVVPVQLRKPQFSGRHKHVSARFCFAVNRMIRELAS